MIKLIKGTPKIGFKGDYSGWTLRNHLKKSFKKIHVILVLWKITGTMDNNMLECSLSTRMTPFMMQITNIHIFLKEEKYLNRITLSLLKMKSKEKIVWLTITNSTFRNLESYLMILNRLDSNNIGINLFGSQTLALILSKQSFGSLRVSWEILYLKRARSDITRTQIILWPLI